MKLLMLQDIMSIYGEKWMSSDVGALCQLGENLKKMAEVSHQLEQTSPATLLL